MYSVRFSKDVKLSSTHFGYLMMQMVCTANLDTNPRVRQHRKTSQSVPFVFPSITLKHLVFKALKDTGLWFTLQGHFKVTVKQNNNIDSILKCLSTKNICFFFFSQSHSPLMIHDALLKEPSGCNNHLVFNTLPLGPAAKQAQENVALSLAKSQRETQISTVFGRIGQ